MEWISVKDRLPLEGEEILIFGKDGYELYHLYGKDHFERHYQDVTHWMPLPEPPVDG